MGYDKTDHAAREGVPKRDLVDEAIAATDAAERQVAMIRIPVQLSTTGRPAAIDLPADASDAELVDLAGWILTALRAHIAATSRPTSRLIVPRRIANQ